MLLSTDLFQFENLQNSECKIMCLQNQFLKVGLHDAFWQFYFVLELFNKSIQVNISTHYQKGNHKEDNSDVDFSPNITIFEKNHKNTFFGTFLNGNRLEKKS